MQVNINGTAHVLPNKDDSCKQQQSGKKRRREDSNHGTENASDINIQGMAGKSEESRLGRFWEDSTQCVHLTKSKI